MSQIIKTAYVAAQKDAFFSGASLSETVEAFDAGLSRDGRETIIVSRHAGAIEWLAQRGITGTAMPQVTPEDVRDKIVIGNLPLHLAAAAHQVGSIDMPDLSAADRGRDLTPEEMDAAGARISWYVVSAV